MGKKYNVQSKEYKVLRLRRPLLHLLPCTLCLILNTSYFVLPNISFGQASLTPQWNKSFGGSGDDELFGFLQTTDKGYILGGTSYSGISGDKTQPSQGNGDFWIVKTDSLANKQWDRRFGGTDNDYFFSFQQTKDGGYILGGASVSGAGGDRTLPSRGGNDYWIVKIDSLGNKQWDRRYGGSDEDWLFAVRQTKDGGYILGGSSLSGAGGDKSQGSRGGWDYWIVKIDALGNRLWDRRFGGSSDDFFYDLQLTTDGGYILGGTSYSDAGGDKSQNSRGIDDFWIVKIDSLGSKQWDKRFGGFISDDLYTLRQTFDGGYIAAGISNSDSSYDKTQPSRGYSDFWIVKMDAAGNKQWDKDFGGTYYEDDFGSIIQTADSGYLLAGTSYSPFGEDKSENNLGPEQTWIIKTSATGVKQWDKTLFTDGHDETGFVLQTTNGCYIAANFTTGGASGTNSYKTQASQGGYDYWMLKFCIDTSVAMPKSLFFTSDSSFCSEPPRCINFYDQSTGNPASWKWLFPGATPDSSVEPSPANICYSLPGTYPVTLIVTNAAGSDSLTISSLIVVKATPATPIIRIGIDTLFGSTSSANASFQWYWNDNVIEGAVDSFFVPSQSGNYSVYIIDRNGCGKLSQSATYDMQFGIYPNPAQGWIAIRGLNTEAVNQINIYNAIGQVVRSISTVKGKRDAINIQDLAAGIYILKIENSSFVAKFVKS